VLWVSPERDEAVALTFQESGNTVRFTAPATKLYAMIVVAH